MSVLVWFSEKMKVHGYKRSKPGGKNKIVHVKGYVRRK